MAQQGNLQPLLANKAEFIRSLDNVIHKAMNMQAAVETALELGDMPAPVKEQLQRACDEFKEALYN